jgi:hypothetical protein
MLWVGLPNGFQLGLEPNHTHLAHNMNPTRVCLQQSHSRILLVCDHGEHTPSTTIEDDARTGLKHCLWEALCCYQSVCDVLTLEAVWFRACFVLREHYSTLGLTNNIDC